MPALPKFQQRWAWMQCGALCWYYPTPHHKFAGVISSKPELLGGHTWTVHITELSADYRRVTGKNTTHVWYAEGDRVRKRTA